MKQYIRLLALAVVSLASLSSKVTTAFCPLGGLPTTSTTKMPHVPSSVRLPRRSPTTTTSPTRLHLLLDVPDGFFTITFPMLGILLSLSKNFARIRMEENAWEQRLADARRDQLWADPTLTELDLRRQEAALEWSAYGKPRWEEEAAAAQAQAAARSRRRVKVQERQGDDIMDNATDETRRRPMDAESRRMTDAEIEAFELEYGVPYDPYYDEPYTAEELPTDVKYQTDRRYGDRIYENGEIFYQHEGLYYRQGAKPRNVKFWQ